jgi:hypothetical protein
MIIKNYNTLKTAKLCHNFSGVIIFILLTFSLLFTTSIKMANAESGKVIAITGGVVHMCAIVSTDGRTGGVKCWEGNRTGSIGDRTLFDRFAPVDVFGLTSEVLAISSGTSQSCAILSDGPNKTVKCWGVGTSTPTIIPGLKNISKISTGSDHACAILADKTVKCWR